jgi:formylglycine-generating enzyme required for sulfatase activity
MRTKVGIMQFPMVHARACIVVTLAVITVYAESAQCQVRTPRENQDAATTLVELGPGQTLVFRWVSPAKYGINYPDFFVLETEVTNAQFKAFLDATNATKNDTDVLKIVKQREKSRVFSTGDIPLQD